MENRKWLPSDTRNRLIDLCKDRNIFQAQLASVIGIDRSALSRFLSGKTDSIRNWIKKTDIPAHKTGKLWEVKKSELDEWVRSGKSAFEH